MIDEDWNKTQNDAPFVAFYDMCAVTFVLPDEMANVSISGLQWFILIPGLNHTGSHRPIDSHSIPYIHRTVKRNIDKNDKGKTALLLLFKVYKVKAYEQREM